MKEFTHRPLYIEHQVKMPPKRKARRTRNSQKAEADNSNVPDKSLESTSASNLNDINNIIARTINTEFIPEVEEWRKGKSLGECHEYMLTNQVACDVYFELGANEDLYGAHKYKLLAVSDVFYIMFLGPMAEHTAIKAPDIELDVFKTFLKFVYTEKLDATPDNVMQLMYVAKKYNIEPMVKSIVDFLDHKLTIESVCTIMEQAHLFNEPLLESKALEYIEDNATEILESKEINSLCPICMRKVLSSDNLHVKLGIRRELWETERKFEAGKLEKSVLTGALTWASHQCEQQNLPVTGENQRKVLGDMIWLIRFSQLSPDYFVEIVTKMNILTSEERCVILENVVAPQKSESKLCNNKRRGPHENIRMVSRFRDIAYEKSMKNDHHHAISFTSSEDLYLHGFCLYGTSKGKTCMYSINTILYANKDIITNMNTTIFDQIDPVDIREKRKSIVLRSTEEQSRVYFRRKLLIKKEVCHTLYVDVQGPPTYCGKDGRPQVCYYTDGFLKIEFHNPPEFGGFLSETNMDRGQIPGLLVSLIPSTKPFKYR